jgi:hypothetical protein
VHAKPALHWQPAELAALLAWLVLLAVQTVTRPQLVVKHGQVADLSLLVHGLAAEAA